MIERRIESFFVEEFTCDVCHLRMNCESTLRRQVWIKNGHQFIVQVIPTDPNVRHVCPDCLREIFTA